MTATLIDRLIEDGDADVVGAETIGAYLDAAPETVTMLFFTGDPAKKLETPDLAVVLREIKRGRPDDLRLAVVDRADEAKLMKPYGVPMLPSTVFMAGRRRLGVAPKVKDWAFYERAVPDFIREARSPAPPPLPNGADAGGAVHV
ncbi:MAG: hydrogenase-1 expression HyaE [Pseudomonadota bacterium]